MSSSRAETFRTICRGMLVVSLAAPIGSCKKQDGPDSVTREWQDELSLTPDRSLVEIAGTPPSTLWAVGDGLFKRDKTSWREVEFPSRPRSLASVATVGEEVWAIGRSGTVAHFDTKIWKLERVGGEGHTADVVDALAWPGEVWAFGAKGEIWRRKGDAWQGDKPAELANKPLRSAWGPSASRVFVSTGTGVADWDGKRWRVSELAPEVTIRSVHGAAVDDVWAVGDRPLSIGKGAAIFRFDGAAWKRIEPPVDVALASVYARSKNEVWAGGDQGTLLTFDGTSWRKVSGLPSGPVTQVFAPAEGPLLVATDQRRIHRAR